MNTYISFLRGINVSGQKKIKMEDLKKMYESLGCEDVKTYIQSGNVVFKSVKDQDEIEKEIRGGINRTFGFDAGIFVTTRNHIEDVLSANPFKNRKDFNTKTMYFTFLKKEPDKALTGKLETEKPTNDSFEIIGKEIYLYCPGGYGRTVYSNNYFENKLKMEATTRNWNTVTKMVEMAE